MGGDQSRLPSLPPRMRPLSGGGVLTGPSILFQWMVFGFLGRPDRVPETAFSQVIPVVSLDFLLSASKFADKCSHRREIFMRIGKLSQAMFKDIL